MGNIKIGIIGIGNCASSLIQGINYYRDKDNHSGIISWNIGGYFPSQIDVVAAFDVDKRKVGLKLSQAIFSKPNCTKVFCENIIDNNIKVNMGITLDSISPLMKNYEEDERFVRSEQLEPSKNEIIQILRDSGCEILVNFLPVGSEKAAKFYAECALDANIAFINCIPVLVANDKELSAKFEEKRIPLIGDDIKAQIGATITHRALTNLFKIRGVKIEKTYQLNTGGNTDFLNMLDRDRLRTKKITKTESVQSTTSERIKSKNIHIGPSDYIPWLNDNKICYIRLEGKIFGDVPMEMDIKLSVEDSPNSAGIVIDAIRYCKVALKNGIGGVLKYPSSYFMKYPPIQVEDNLAFQELKKSIQ